MNTDIVVDDEFFPREADTAVRYMRETESQGRRSYIQHQLGINLRKLIQTGLDDIKWKFAVIQESLITFTATGSNFHTICEQIGRISAANDRRHTHFAGDDGSM